ncbi:hypothetical protein [Dietzia psychralcaliphila]|uniref:Uncharacterized protein n=1 Tax=Dietzia psychralcaliphila TaxID=139021 RepID=A0AAD0JQI7_9ACTN|nr:hypothetical protein [Dietzia psychralcaliphila]AWH95917.1 hypothetical protein A6048_10800 [Dietzia psychralcaliphila]PTM85891.1 hypothetical protein C8N39_10972 [Dietzia psychralcaliphila]
MNTDGRSLPRKFWLSRGAPLDRDHAASRISAYIYGNILVLAALVPLVQTEKYVGIAIVVGTAVSTFIAHAFAEAVGHSVREGAAWSRAEMIAELRNSVPILNSAVLPSLILAIGWVGVFELRTALLLAEITVLVRIGGIVFVIGRLNGERPSRSWFISAAALTAVAATIVVVKIVLTH